jgi:hypothetical protein
MTAAYKLANPVIRAHDQGLTQPDGTKVVSRQDWTEKCPAGTQTSTKTCPFPVAKAYDHQDKEVTVKTRVFLVDMDGKTVNTAVEKVDFTKRSTYLFKYDASDSAGNHAEQVVFALILNDDQAPTISMCNGMAETVEAASDWSLCATSTAFDNIDGSLTDSIKYSVQSIHNEMYLCQNAGYTQAKESIGTKKVGRFLVTLAVNDNAGVYGHNAQDNHATAHKAVLVQDTRAPWIAVHGAVPSTQECAIAYSDLGATAKDLLDTEALGKKIEVSLISTVNSAKVGDYSVTYDAKDTAGNVAKTMTRGVLVRDTTKPQISLKGNPVVVHYSEQNFVDPGATTSDTCDKSLSPFTTTWNKAFNDRTLGDYIRTYSVTDHSGNKAAISRKFTIVDNTKPIISMNGQFTETYEASRDVEYTDKGAACKDYVDGVLNHAVEVSGEVVNMRVPGKYTIRYDCQDLSGNQAVPLSREVTIQDTVCPVVQLKGSSINYVEAGFPYVDAGATATDSLDGDLTSKVFTDGDTVDTAQAFYSRRSCREILASYAAAKTGEYYITTFVGSAFKRTLVWCDMTAYASAHKGQTYYQCANCVRVPKAYSAEHQGSCAGLGLKMAQFLNADGTYNADLKTMAMKKFDAKFFANPDESTDDYLCSTNDIGSDHTVTQSTQHTEITRAEAGKYVIFFHVSDSAGNAECKTLKRTVIVKDTLPPVITLHLKNQLIHQSQGDQSGLGGEKNPAGTAANPFLKSFMEAPVQDNQFMAETQTSVNGWLIGAVASAVAGVALLGMSAKKTAVSVPV